MAIIICLPCARPPPQNGNKSQKTINEGQTLLTVFKEGYAPDGVWLGGTKYQFINIERDLEFEGYTFDVATCAKLKGGLHLIKVPGGNILVVLYDEEKEHDRGRSSGRAVERFSCLANHFTCEVV